MTIQPTQPQPIGAVLDTSFQLYKASLGRVWAICLLFVLAGLPQGIYVLTAPPGTPSALDPTGMLDLMTRPAYWGVSVVAGLVSLWALGALYLKQEAIGAGRDLAIGAALQRSLTRLVPSFFMGVLFSIALLIGFILFFVPGVILTVSLMLGWNLLLLEGKGPIASLAGSHRLVWGNWWRTAAILTVGLIIFFVLYFALALIIGIVIPIFTSQEQDALLYTFISSLVLSALLSFIATPYYVALLMSVYWDLKLRKEGGDLAARVGALNAA
jgi:hypothetical protein